MHCRADEGCEPTTLFRLRRAAASFEINENICNFPPPYQFLQIRSLACEMLFSCHIVLLIILSSLWLQACVCVLVCVCVLDCEL